MFRPFDNKIEHHNATTSLTLQSLIDARHNINRFQRHNLTGGTRFPGQHAGQRRGQGLEFIDLRQYNEGDDVRHIDWNVTARSNEPYTRLFREEREQVTTVIVDLRPMMFTGSDCLRSVSAGQLAACALWQACENGDRCAAMVISAAGITSSRPGAGNKAVLRALELIASGFNHTNEFIHTGHAPVSTAPVLSDTLTLINSNRRSSGRYILFSGLDTKDDPQWYKLLPATSMTGLLKVVMLLDRLEKQTLPAGRYTFQSSRGATTTTIASDNSDQYTQKLQQNIQSRTRHITNNGIPLLTIDTQLPPGELLVTLQQDDWL